jgi:hypothetical protein
LPAQLLSRAAAYDPLQLARVVVAAAKSTEILEIGRLLGAVERTIEHTIEHDGNPLLPLRAALMRLREARMATAGTQERRREVARIEALLGKEMPGEPEADDAWGRRAVSDLAAMPDAARSAWTALFRHALGGSGARPSKPWLKEARACIQTLGDAAFKAQAIDWFSLVQKPAELRLVVSDGYPHYAPALAERNADLLRGLVWACATLDDSALARSVGDLAVVCFTKIPSVGPVSAKVGNACVYTLGAAPGLEGVAQLGRLKTRVKYTVANRLIEKALDAAAARTGTDKDALEDLAVPTFGLTEPGRGQFTIGDFTAEMTIAEDDSASLLWRTSGGGKAQASVPAELSRERAPEVKALRKQAKDVASMLAAQRVRLERLLGGERSWRHADSRARFLDHPLLASLARRLVWQLQDGDRATLAAWSSGRFVDVDDRPVPWL